MFKQLNKLKQRDKLLLINILFIILFFGIYYFVIRSGLSELASLDQDIRAKLNTLQILEKKGGDVKKFKQSLTSADNVVGKISEYFIKDEVEFVTSIENTAAKLGLTERLSMGEPKINGKVKVVPITLYTHGTFRQQLAFINELSELKYFLSIRSVDFAKVNAKASAIVMADQQIDMSLSINTYWQSDEK